MLLSDKMTCMHAPAVLSVGLIARRGAVGVAGQGMNQP